MNAKFAASCLSNTPDKFTCYAYTLVQELACQLAQCLLLQLLMRLRDILGSSDQICI